VSIVQSISFHDELSIEDSVYENGYKDKYLFKRVESITIEEIKLSKNVLLGEAC